MIGILTTAALIAFLILLIIFIISALPLYFAVRLLNGKTTLFKTAVITFISGAIVSIVNYFFKTWGALIAFFLLIWIYHETFRLKWHKAFLAWILQLAFIIAFRFILNFITALFGIALSGVF